MKRSAFLPLREALLGLNRQVLAQRQEQHLVTLEGEATRYIGSVFQRQGEIVLERFSHLQHYFTEEMRDDMNWMLDQSFLQTFPAFRDGILRYSVLASMFGTQTLPQELGLRCTFDAVNHDAISLLQQYAAREVKGINDTTRARIHDLVTQGFEQHRSYSQIAEDIRKEFAQFSELKPQKHIRNRAQLVAVTEIRKVHSATRLAACQALQDRGYAIEKYWHNREDDRVSAGCRRNTAAGWIPLNDAFPSGHLTTPRFPGCRCWTLERVAPRTAATDKFSVTVEGGDTIAIRPNLAVLTAASATAGALA